MTAALIIIAEVGGTGAVPLLGRHRWGKAQIAEGIARLDLPALDEPRIPAVRAILRSADVPLCQSLTSGAGKR